MDSVAYPLAQLTRNVRRSLPLRLLLIGAAVLGYAAVSLWPLDWNPPRLSWNGAEWVPGGGIRFDTPGLAVTPGPLPWLAAVKETNRLEIELRARSFRSDYGSFARILTISESHSDYNLYIGQRGRALTLRLYRTCRWLEQLELPCRSGHTERDVFEIGQWVDIAVLIEPGKVALRVDGEQVYERKLSTDLLAAWAEDHRLALGNEVHGNGPWLGEIAHATVRLPGLEQEYADPAALVLPARYWFFDRDPKLLPFEGTSRRDVRNNLILYMPLGLLLAALRRTRGRFEVLWALGCIAAVSLSMEVAQLFFSSRNPSVTDVILNAAGGALSFTLARRLRQNPLARRLLRRPAA